MSPGEIAVKIRSTANARIQGFLLDNIYILETTTDPEKLSSLLATYPEVVYAEVIPHEELLHVPSDPLADPNSRGQGYCPVLK